MRHHAILLILLLIILNAQSQFTYFEKMYNNDAWSVALSIVEMDSGYVMVGVSGENVNQYQFKRVVLTAIDDKGNQLWWKIYGEDFHHYYAGGSRGCISTSDGGFAISGTIDNGYSAVGSLMRFDSNGDSLWCRRYGDTVEVGLPVVSFELCQELPDKGFIITGQIQWTGTNSDVLLVRTDSLGNMEWSNYYGDEDWWESPASIAQLPGGDFLVGITKQTLLINNFENDAGLIKIDSLGNKKWLKYYNGPFENRQAIVELANDGNYLVGSCYGEWQEYVDYPWQKVWLFKTDTAGNVLWDKKYGEKPFTGWCASIEENENGDIILGGTAYYLDEYGDKAWIFKADQDGDSIWMRHYLHYPEWINELWDFRICSDHGIIFAGQTWMPEEYQVIWVMKLDSIACDSAGCDTTVWIREVLGIETPRHEGMELWPNPCRETLNLQISMPDALKSLSDEGVNYEIIVVDFLGRQVISEPVVFKRAGSWQIDVSSLPTGIYMAILIEEQDVVSGGKFMIVR
jgi:hypothetical protein